MAIDQGGVKSGKTPANCASTQRQAYAYKATETQLRGHSFERLQSQMSQRFKRWRKSSRERRSNLSSALRYRRAGRMVTPAGRSCTTPLKSRN